MQRTKLPEMFTGSINNTIEGENTNSKLTNCIINIGFKLIVRSYYKITRKPYNLYNNIINPKNRINNSQCIKFVIKL